MENGQNENLFLQIIPLKVRDSKLIQKADNNPLQRIKVSSDTTLFTIASYILRLAEKETQDKSIVYLYTMYGRKSVEFPQSFTIEHYFFITGQSKDGEIRYSFVDKDDHFSQTKQIPKTSFVIKSVMNEETVLPNDSETTQHDEYSSNEANDSSDSNSFDNSDNHNSNSNVAHSPVYQYPEPSFQIPPLIGDSNFQPPSNFGDSNFALNSMNQVIHTGISFFSMSYGFLPQASTSFIDASRMNDNSTNSSSDKVSDEVVSLKNDLEQILKK
ncbi:hypothetical protein TRFO_25852 [Tritrichomonas foetus]|uniref:Uncharacterized protein n=1 Tax=Tritrichomonas foetus TaxID=1144522 RepID=A0A1J4K3Y5_9EUKA|nr:hypothetical protein TRFO_25852 [Tritrichomonas foetus]|eukprot:OHT06161.1 hypothetical protein TRFO_25852 [Tritrichomonas foetus]